MSKKIRILFYVTPKFKWKYTVNWLISLWTRSKYSHCEIEDPADGIDIGGTIQDFWENGTCYTATMRGEANGTVKRPASEVLDHPEHWEYVEVELDDADYEMMMDYMQDEVDNNGGYSKWDLMKFLSPIHFPDNKRNICSEFVNNALYYATILDKKGIISPKKLHKKLTRLGYKTEPLQERK